MDIEELKKTQDILKDIKSTLDSKKCSLHLKDFPLEILLHLEECQENQGNEKDLSILDNLPSADRLLGGFDWDDEENSRELPESFYCDLILNRNFDLYYEHF